MHTHWVVSRPAPIARIWLARFKRGRQDVGIKLKATTVGLLQTGGANEWGFGLVLGIAKNEYFGGKYEGTAENRLAVGG